MIPAWLIPYAITGVVSAALVGGTVWFVQEGRYDRAVAEREAVVSQLAMAEGDARRQAQAVETYTDTIAKMSEEAERQRADLAQAEAILRTVDEVARAEAADLNAEIAKWKERARANPQDVRPVGPIVRDAYCHVMRQAGQVPAGCPAAD